MLWKCKCNMFRAPSSCSLVKYSVMQDLRRTFGGNKLTVWILLTLNDAYVTKWRRRHSLCPLSESQSNFRTCTSCHALPINVSGGSFNFRLIVSNWTSIPPKMEEYYRSVPHCSTSNQNMRLSRVSKMACRNHTDFTCHFSNRPQLTNILIVRRAKILVFLLEQSYRYANCSCFTSTYRSKQLWIYNVLCQAPFQLPKSITAGMKWVTLYLS